PNAPKNNWTPPWPSSPSSRRPRRRTAGNPLWTRQVTSHPSPGGQQGKGERQTAVGACSSTQHGRPSSRHGADHTQECDLNSHLARRKDTNDNQDRKNDASEQSYR